jgi:hypothetical protein
MKYKLINSITITRKQDEEMKQEQPVAAEEPAVEAPAEARRPFLLDLLS